MVLLLALALQTEGGRPLVISPAKLPAPYHTRSVRSAPLIVRAPKTPYLKAPSGFKVTTFAAGLNSPRWLLSLPNGDILCAESYQGRVRLLRDTDNTNVVDKYITLLTGLNLPFGMAWGNDSLYVANTDSVYRYSYRLGQTRISAKPQKIVTGLPSKGWRQHWTRNILFTPDGKQFYLTVGSETNKSPEKPPRATILRFNADGSGRTVYATGLRNPVGLAHHPQTRDLWTSNIERDYMGDDLVPDFVTSVREGDFFGWPWFYIGRNLDPALAKMRPPATEVKVPDILMTAHSVPLGILFYQGKQFPAGYSGDMFVSMRGSTNRSVRSGYKVVRVRFENGKPLPGVEDFVTGWAPDPTKRQVFGRPVGLAVWKDGSLLVADESAHKIWRISFGN